MFSIKRMLVLGVLAVLLGLGGFSAQTQQPADFVLVLRDETAGRTLLTLDRNGLLELFGRFKGSGELLTNLNASSITVGALSISRLPLGDLDNRYDSRYAARSHVHDDRYYTQSTADSRFVNASGDRMSDDLDMQGNDIWNVDELEADRIYTQDGTRWLFSDSAGNTFLGRAAGINNNPASSCCDGWNNTAIGYQALSSNTTGGYNTAVGWQALRSNTTGSGNTAVGERALRSNTTGSYNTALGLAALRSNTTGVYNTALGLAALFSNTTGNYNTALGFQANVASGDLTNATAIGYGAVVCCSNTIRLGNDEIVRIEGRVGFTATSDKNQKENFRPVDGKAVLEKLLQLPISSWNFIGQDPKQFRHYGPNSQDFFALFGHDGVGTVGDERTINTLDFAGVLAAGLQALYQRHLELEQKVAQQARELEELRARLQEILQRLEAKE